MDPAVFLGGRPIPKGLRPKKDDLVLEAVEMDEDPMAEDIEELLKL